MAEENKPDITLEQAIQKTKEAGFNLSYQGKETIIGIDLFELKKDIEKTKTDIRTINFIFSVVIVAAVIAVILMLADYFQFTIKAYDQFNDSIKSFNSTQMSQKKY
ncbi:MAG: hypothetical protein UR91_C0035G0002 [Candidatus Nomurabacteria bacterium GW2011_GWC2_35_8]|uniref:Uncharacterized protein n=2 Tax=Candidatus Nomuraibacteriota TaxID=1752729 RepID=A0A1F6YHX0_9BACT|nr:MAG: hypothetical protein UR91_C0035G0002 [Candidatus Nomurabacteria bacterium GW2011_GWC2_35_8]OGJ05917.1 MAG: hypothetical protein A2192_01630 [Candidatus Nomurabacteria bacterium RIFOXYA1_FULL_35_17]OGJ13698.1 MAG: hypothetical protein A2554_00920 [Candidatus Nomurabacteria bacterium RIFOXYD2_FULL_35_12]